MDSACQHTKADARTEEQSPRTPHMAESRLTNKEKGAEEKRRKKRDDVVVSL